MSSFWRPWQENAIQEVAKCRPTWNNKSITCGLHGGWTIHTKHAVWPILRYYQVFFRVVVRIFPAVKLPPWCGPGNMAVYRHILVIRPTAKVCHMTVTIEKRKTAYRQNNTAVLRYHQKTPPYFGFTASVKKIPPSCVTTKKHRHVLVLPLP